MPPIMTLLFKSFFIQNGLYISFLGSFFIRLLGPIIRDFEKSGKFTGATYIDGGEQTP